MIPITQHPDFAFCMPTTDIEVGYFYLENDSKKHEIHFDYFEICPVWISYWRTDGKLWVQIKLKTEQPGAESSPEELEALTWQRLSLWINTEEEAKNYKTLPTEVVKYSLWEDFEQTFEFEDKPNVLLGFYTNFWDL